jgi:hypothetical protein
MMMKSVILQASFFKIGLITDFTDISELVWMRRFSINQTEIFSALVNLAWAFRILAAKKSDEYAIRISPFYQCALITFPPALCWCYISSYSELADGHLILLLILFGEFGPAVDHTILDGIKSVHFHRSGENLTSACETARLIGSLLSSVCGGYMLLHYGTSIVFLLQSIFLFFATFFFTCYASLVQMDDDDGVEDDETTPKPIKDEEKEEEVLHEISFYETGKEILGAEHTNRAFIVFVLVQSSLPTGGNGLAYFLFGPLQFTAFEFNVMDSVSIVIGIIVASSLRFFPNPNSRIALLLAFGTCIGQFGTYALVSRLHLVAFESFPIPDLGLYFAILLLNQTILSVTIVLYQKTATESTCEHNEATGYSLLASIPALGRMIRNALNIFLTWYFQIDHDDYEFLPTVLLVTNCLAAIGIVVALFC